MLPRFDFNIDYRYNHKCELLLFLLIQVDGGAHKTMSMQGDKKQEKKYDLGVQNKKKGKKKGRQNKMVKKH